MPLAAPPTPRNHARRVDDLLDLHRQGLIRFIESTRTEGGKAWTYVVDAAGERMRIPARLVDMWLTGWRQAVTTLNGGRALSAAPNRNGHAPNRTRSDDCTEAR